MSRDLAITMEQIAGAIPAGRGLLIRELRAMFPGVLDMGAMLRRAQAAGLVELDNLSNKWRKAGSIRPLSATPNQAARACAHPGCQDRFTPARSNELYCAEHRQQKYASQRHYEQKKAGALPPTKAAVAQLSDPPPPPAPPPEQSPLRQEPAAAEREADDAPPWAADVLSLPARAGIVATHGMAGNSLVVRIESDNGRAVELVGGQVGAFHQWLSRLMATTRSSAEDPA